LSQTGENSMQNLKDLDRLSKLNKLKIRLKEKKPPLFNGVFHKKGISAAQSEYFRNSESSQEISSYYRMMDDSEDLSQM
jgi:hypothetical protein